MSVKCSEYCVVYKSRGHLLDLGLICMFLCCLNFPLLKNICKAPPVLILLSVLLLI